MEARATPNLFTAEEQRQLTWLQLSLVVGVIGEFILVPPVSHIATVLIFGFPLVLWIVSASQSATRSCTGRHIIFTVVNYMVYPVLIFLFISQLALGSFEAGAEILADMPDNELAFVYLITVMVQGIPSTMGAERLMANIALIVLLIIYLRVLVIPLVNVYKLYKQKIILYPIAL